MDKSNRNKSKTKKSKSNKKLKSDADLTRKLAAKKKQEENCPKNIVQTIISSLTNALPFKFSKKSPPEVPSPVKIETLRILAPELVPNEALSIDIPPRSANFENVTIQEVATIQQKSQGFKMPKMPLVSSEVLKIAARETKIKVPVKDQAVNTGTDHDIASELVKHVNTLRKISLIAEEFNQKTAKNLKEIVDSVQEDLIKKLEEIQAENEKAGPSHLQDRDDQTTD